MCQHDEFERPRGCRRTKTAPYAVKRLIGHQCGPHGDIPTYTRVVRYFCQSHAVGVSLNEEVQLESIAADWSNSEGQP